MLNRINFPLIALVKMFVLANKQTKNTQVEHFNTLSLSDSVHQLIYWCIPNAIQGNHVVHVMSVVYMRFGASGHYVILQKEECPHQTSDSKHLHTSSKAAKSAFIVTFVR